MALVTIDSISSDMSRVMNLSCNFKRISQSTLDKLLVSCNVYLQFLTESVNSTGQSVNQEL